MLESVLCKNEDGSLLRRIHLGAGEAGHLSLQGGDDLLDFAQGRLARCPWVGKSCR